MSSPDLELQATEISKQIKAGWGWRRWWQMDRCQRRSCRSGPAAARLKPISSISMKTNLWTSCFYSVLQTTVSRGQTRVKAAISRHRSSIVPAVTSCCSHRGCSVRSDAASEQQQHPAALSFLWASSFVLETRMLDCHEGAYTKVTTL